MLGQQYGTMGPPWRGLKFLCGLLLCVFAWSSVSSAAEKTPKPKPAKFGISGYGLMGNLELRRTVRRVGLSGKKPEFFNSDFVEDTALIVGARVRSDGYLKPKITIRLKLADGREIRTDADSLLDNPLPRDIRIVDARFIIHRGTLYYFNTLEFQGLETVSQREARGYFVDTDILLRTRRSRLFTEERLRRGIASLTDVLDRQGYRDVQVTSKELGRNDKTGAMDIRIEVQQGPKYIVHS